MTPDDEFAATPVGHRWLLTGLRAGTDVFVVGPSLPEAYLDLHDDGWCGIDDSVNYSSGTYRLRDGGLELGEQATTLAGYDHRDPDRSRVILALGELAAVDDDGTDDDATAWFPLTLVDGVLEIVGTTTTLVFRRAGTVTTR